MKFLIAILITLSFNVKADQTFSFIQQFESMSHTIYWVDNKPHICMGRLLSPKEYASKQLILEGIKYSLSRKVSDSFCAKLFEYEIRKIDGMIKGHVLYPLSPSQHVALRSYIYNAGWYVLYKRINGRFHLDKPSKFLKALNSWNIPEAIKLMNIITASGRVFPGLRERRLKEQELFKNDWMVTWN